MKKMKGLTLIIVLFFLQILTVLGLFSLQMAQMITKQCHHSWYHHLAVNQAREALIRVENNLTQFPACLVPVSYTAEMMSRPLAWWQSSSCAGNFHSFEYYYVVEFLGSDPCALIQTGAQRISSDYFRITLVAIAGTTKHMLQSTVVAPSRESNEICHGISHTVMPGRQMWRELN